MVTKQQFMADLLNNYTEMMAYGVGRNKAKFFLPPYEWYNDSIAAWTNEMGLQLINYTPGTLSIADYTTPGMKNYRSSEAIYNSIIHLENARYSGMNGFILLVHIGTDPGRTDKFYDRLPELIRHFQGKGYRFQTIDRLLKID